MPRIQITCAWIRREMAAHDRALVSAMPPQTVYRGETHSRADPRARYREIMARQKAERQPETRSRNHALRPATADQG